MELLLLSSSSNSSDGALRFVIMCGLEISLSDNSKQRRLPGFVLIAEDDAEFQDVEYFCMCIV
jgi:hypothetical protein